VVDRRVGPAIKGRDEGGCGQRFAPEAAVVPPAVIGPEVRTYTYPTMTWALTGSVRPRPAGIACGQPDPPGSPSRAGESWSAKWDWRTTVPFGLFGNYSRHRHFVAVSHPPRENKTFAP